MDNQETLEWREDVQAVLDRMLADYEDDPDEPIMAVGSRVYSVNDVVNGYKEGDYFLRRFCGFIATEYEKFEREQDDHQQSS